MTPLLAVDDLEVVYQRAIVALQGISLKVSQGQIVAILGANGAGKTTTLRAISGFIGLDNARIGRGRVAYAGQVINNLRPSQIARRGIVLVPERDKVFPNLSVAENLAVVGSHNSAPRRRQLEDQVFVSFPRLMQLRTREAGLLSGGERQMLAIGAAIVAAPQLLLIDELSLGLAPVIIDELLVRLLEIRRQLGLTLVLVEQSATKALDVADYAYVLENGRVALEGPSSELRHSDQIQALYLGTSRGQRISYRHARSRREGVPDA